MYSQIALFTPPVLEKHYSIRPAIDIEYWSDRTTIQFRLLNKEISNYSHVEIYVEVDGVSSLAQRQTKYEWEASKYLVCYVWPDGIDCYKQYKFKFVYLKRKTIVKESSYIFVSLAEQIDPVPHLSIFEDVYYPTTGNIWCFQDSADLFQGAAFFSLIQEQYEIIITPSITYLFQESVNMITPNVPSVSCFQDSVKCIFT